MKQSKYLWIAAAISLLFLIAGLFVMFSAVSVTENGGGLMNSAATALIGATMCLPFIIIKSRFF